MNGAGGIQNLSGFAARLIPLILTFSQPGEGTPLWYVIEIAQTVHLPLLEIRTQLRKLPLGSGRALDVAGQ